MPSRMTAAGSTMPLPTSGNAGAPETLGAPGSPGGPHPAHAAGPASAANRPGTLRRRLLATGLGALAAGLLVCGLGAHTLLAHTLAERHRVAVAAEADALGRAVAAAAPRKLNDVLEAFAARPGVTRLVVLAGDEVPYQWPAGAAQTPAAGPSGGWGTLAAAAFDPPVATGRAATALPAGGPEVRLELTAAARGHAATLAWLDLHVALLLLGSFALVAPALVWVVIRRTAPLADLRDAVLLARRAGQAGVAVQPPPRAGSSELTILCRAIDALGADVAQARVRLSTANEELLHQVRSRTAELSQANRQLEAEARDKDHFLRAVTHDLNAPLRNIDGLSKLLLSKHAAELSEGAASRLERIGINVKHQHELINDLLELSRLRTKAHRPVELRLGELVDEVAGGLGYDLESSGIAFEMVGAWPVIHAERNRFRQVFQNLIDNAIKYMMDSEERRITAEVTRERDFEADIFQGVDSYRFSVVDTGRGIAAEDLDSVFRVFSRSTHSGTHDVAGRGVGLACVEAIVRRYGGRVGVESTLGEGSRFWFTVPVAAVAAPDAEAATPAAETHPAAEPHRAAA